jgi:hypothetical protein
LARANFDITLAMAPGISSPWIREPCFLVFVFNFAHSGEETANLTVSMAPCRRRLHGKKRHSMRRFQPPWEEIRFTSCIRHPSSLSSVLPCWPFLFFFYFFIFLLAGILTLLYLLLGLARGTFNRTGVRVSAAHGRKKWRAEIIYMLPGADNSDLVR